MTEEATCRYSDPSERHAAEDANARRQLAEHPEARQYIGTIFIHAWPEERDGRAGYGVAYNIGTDLPAYRSWSPADVFERAYSAATIYSFGDALALLNNGHRLRRKGWNGKGQWIVKMGGLKLPPFSSQEPGAKVNDRTAMYIGVDTLLDSQPYIALWNSQGKWQPGWAPSQGDLFATDWEIVLY